MTLAQFIDPLTADIPRANPFQPGSGPLAKTTDPGSTNRGLATISYGDRVFRFRTNPNEIWWSYELITHVDQTYGGRVVQLLGTRLGDLTVKVEAGRGGWDYLVKTAMYLRDVLSDQRGDQTATFEYTTRNWKLNVYAMNIPFEDQVSATVREMSLQFKIQEDVTGVISQATLDTALAQLQDGVYLPNQNVHNEYNDAGALGRPLDQAQAGPASYTSPTGLPNQVDSKLQGDNPGGLNPIGGIPFLPSIPGLGSLLGGVGG